MNIQLPRYYRRKRPDMKALRTADYERIRQPLRLRLRKFARNLFSDLVRLVTPCKLSTTMCKNYGHIIDKNWKGSFPHCNECGIKVEDPSLLRKSDPINSKP